MERMFWKNEDFRRYVLKVLFGGIFEIMLRILEPGFLV